MWFAYFVSAPLCTGANAVKHQPFSFVSSDQLRMVRNNVANSTVLFPQCLQVPIHADVSTSE